MIPALQGYYLDTVQVNVSIGDGVFNDLAPARELTPKGLTSVATSKDVIPATIGDTTLHPETFPICGRLTRISPPGLRSTTF